MDTARRIARQFSLVGWLGLTVQGVLAALAVSAFTWVLFASGPRRPLRFTDYLALLGLAILVFTVAWSYRYIQLGRRIPGAEPRPSRHTLLRTIWVGLGAGSLGIVVSTLLLIAEVTRLLILVLRTPQAGVPVIQTQTDSSAAWVSAIDVVSLLSDVCTLAGELLVVGLALWLLFRVTFADDHAP